MSDGFDLKKPQAHEPHCWTTAPHHGLCPPWWKDPDLRLAWLFTTAALVVAGACGWFAFCRWLANLATEDR